MLGDEMRWLTVCKDAWFMMIHDDSWWFWQVVSRWGTSSAMLHPELKTDRDKKIKKRVIFEYFIVFPERLLAQNHWKESIFFPSSLEDGVFSNASCLQLCTSPPLVANALPVRAPNVAMAWCLKTDIGGRTDGMFTCVDICFILWSIYIMINLYFHIKICNIHSRYLFLYRFQLLPSKKVL